MVAGDKGYPYYAFTGGYVMNAAGTAKLRVQLHQSGLPPVVMPPTISVPPGSAPATVPAAVAYTLTIGITTYTDTTGNNHAPGTWASFTLTGNEFPVGGIYNTSLEYAYAGLDISSAIEVITVSPRIA